MAMSVSVVIPTFNASKGLPALLHRLTDGAVDGIVREVIIADGGSTDETLQIAENFGATLAMGEKGRGQQLQTGARLARGEWLLFIHADTIPAKDWIGEIRRFIDGDAMQRENRAGVFQLEFDERNIGASIVSWGAMIRTRIFKLPYGDQGLLISRRLYDEIGGYGEMSLFEDVDMIERLVKLHGRKALHVFNSPAITSARRYNEEGYIRRVIRNFFCIMMYRCGMSMKTISSFYHGQKR